MEDILFKDICSRLPYGIIVQYKGHNTIVKNKLLTGSDLDCNMEYYKPYLRPMSSMTEEEWQEYQLLKMTDWVGGDINGVFINAGTITDWLNAHHFDYHGLIEKDLAIEVAEENNPYK